MCILPFTPTEYRVLRKFFTQANATVTESYSVMPTNPIQTINAYLPGDGTVQWYADGRYYGYTTNTQPAPTITWTYASSVTNAVINIPHPITHGTTITSSASGTVSWVENDCEVITPGYRRT